MQRLNSKWWLLSFLISVFCIFVFAGCGNDSKVVSIGIDEDYVSTVCIGEMDFSKYYLNVLYANGVKEKVQITEDMVKEEDLFKFHKEGECEITFYYDNFYCTADFSIVKKDFASDICFGENEFVYDGMPHSLQLVGTIPAGTTISYPNGNSYTESSLRPYDIVAILSKDGYNSKQVEGQLIINKAPYDQEKLDAISFEDTTYTYDGKEKSIYARNYPSDLSVHYYINGEECNSKVNAGEYIVRLKIECENNNYLPIEDKIAKLVIKKATYDMSKINFIGNTFNFDKLSHEIKLENESLLPEGVTVTYRNNIQTDAGEYEVYADFSGDFNNYNQIASLKAILKINKKQIDLSSVVFDMQVLQYDGECHTYTLIPDNIPSILTLKLTYKFNDEVVENAVEVGEYVVEYELVFVEGEKESNYEITKQPTGTPLIIIEEVEGGVN